MPRIYLDNAATSWPKPERVYAAIDHFNRAVGASAGRGAYQSAMEASRIVESARRQCATLLGVLDPRRIAFLPSATAAINQAVHGFLKSGDHVVSTVCEHNSVVRPLAEVRRRLGVETTYVGCDGAGRIDPDDVARAVRPHTRLVAMTHASNVTGAIQPVREIAAVARARGIFVLLDAAQTAGHIPVDFHGLGVDMLAASGHKGLLGPLGTSLLVVREGLEKALTPIQQGGTGVESQRDRQPDDMPLRFESGSTNAPALAGLAAAAEYLREHSVVRVAAHEAALTRRLGEGLEQLPGVQVHGPAAAQPRAAVLSFSAAGFDPQELASALDASAGVECRAGLHCAPKMHAALGTLDMGGTVRLSPGWSTTEDDIDRALETIAALTGR